MGNWRTVKIEGTCHESEVDALTKAVVLDIRNGGDLENFHCLSSCGGLCGLPRWPARVIDVIGNLAERDYSVEDVRETLEDLAKAAPSLSLKVHCGGDYEDKVCIATVTLKDGVAVVGEPEIEELPEINEAQVMGNLFAALQRKP